MSLKSGSYFYNFFFKYYERRHFLENHVQCQGVPTVQNIAQIYTENNATATVSLARVSVMSVLLPSYVTSLQGVATASDGAFQTSPSIAFSALIGLFIILQYRTEKKINLSSEYPI